MSSRRLQDMSSRRLQDVFSLTILRLPRRLGRRKIVTLKTSRTRLQDQQMFAGGVLIVNFGQISCIVLMFPSLTVIR